jgi:soluble lytic murein transglycosylase-like protein
MSLPLSLPDSGIPCAGCADPISSAINELIAIPGNVVHLLPDAGIGMKTKRAGSGWRAGEDFREICHCQVHARKQRAWWRRGLRSIRNTSARARSGVALLVGLPIVFGAGWAPLDALSRYAAVARELKPAVWRIREIAAATSFPVFTTEKVRRTFLSAKPEQQLLTLEVSKEAFFRAHVPFGSIIYREARRNNLPPELVAAVVESESGFRPTLTSNRNAQGLMQIVPETGRQMGYGNLFNPEENIAAGTKYLRYLFDRFDDEKLVLAAYNAGEGNIERFGGVPPFPETLTYLNTVVQRRADYSRQVSRIFVAESRLQKSANQ